MHTRTHFFLFRLIVAIVVNHGGEKPEGFSPFLVRDLNAVAIFSTVNIAVSNFKKNDLIGNVHGFDIFK